MISYTARLILLTVMAGVAVFAQTPTATPRERDEIVRLSNVWMQAAMDHDMKTLNGLMADDYSLVHPSQDTDMSRADWLRDLANIKIKRFNYRQLKVHHYGTSLAIVHGVLVVDSDLNGQPQGVARTSVTDVWEKRHGEWRVVTRYSTPPEELPGSSDTSQTPTTTRHSDDLARLSNVWMQAAKDHDMKTLESLMADGFALVFASVPPDKEIPRADWLRNLSSIQTKSFSYQHLKIHHYGKSLAVVNAVLFFDSEMNGQPRAGAITSVSDVWEKQHGKWHVAKRYVTRPEELRGPGATPRPK